MSTSDVWKYFEKLPDNKVKCNLCNKKLSRPKGSTTGMWKHLYSGHQEIYVQLKAIEANKTGEKQPSIVPFVKTKISEKDVAEEQLVRTTCGDSTGTTTKSNNFTTPPRHYVPQMLPPQQQQPRDRLTYFMTFVDATIRDVNAQAPEVANQLMQSIYATIGNYLMHLPAQQQQQQHGEVVPNTTTGSSGTTTIPAAATGAEQHIEMFDTWNS